MYGHMDNLSKEGTVKYAAYASNLKKEEKDAKGEQGGVSGAPVKAADRFRRSSVTGKTHVKKNTMFVLDALASRLDKLNKVNEIQSTSGRNQEMGYEVCQYMSNVRGRFTMPMPVQLMALEEMTDEVLDRWVQVKWPAMGAANTFNRLREIEVWKKSLDAWKLGSLTCPAPSPPNPQDISGPQTLASESGPPNRSRGAIR
jgi:hypothetical protein